MGVVVSFRPEPIAPAWRQWVETVCLFADQPERADDFLARGVPRARIVRDLRAGNPNLRRGNAAAAYLAEMRGPAGTARRPRPLQPAPHGTRRRSTKDTTA